MATWVGVVEPLGAQLLDVLVLVGSERADRSREQEVGQRRVAYQHGAVEVGRDDPCLLHALGWSRQQAIDFMVANSPLTEGVCRPEVDRYICRPGQATSYMVGRLEIQRMRREAEQRQGDRFDVRRFHSAVLDSGALPLGVLDRVVAARLT